MSNNGHSLQLAGDCAKIDTRRKLELFAAIMRHMVGLVYAVAELVLGFRPEKL